MNALSVILICLLVLAIAAIVIVVGMYKDQRKRLNKMCNIALKLIDEKYALIAELEQYKNHNETT